MNRHQFEEQMKDKLQEQQFTPREELWLKLQADLPKKDTSKSKAIIFFTTKIAAGIAMLISLGIATTHLFTENKAEGITHSIATQQAIKQPATIKITASQNIQQKYIASGDKKYNNRILKGHNPNTNQYNNAYPETKNETNIPVIIKSNTQQASNYILNNIPPVATEKNHNNVRNLMNRQAHIDHSMDLYADNNNSKPKAVRIGITANVGSSTVSNVGYQVGMVGRGQVSGTFFVEAELTVASNTVNRSSDYLFPGLSFSSDGLQNTSVNTSTDIKADYTRHVISVGFSPAMGVKAGKRLAFTAGGSVYRNLNPSLALHNENDIDPNALNNNIINTTQKVANWDLGLNCNAEYKVTKKLSFNVNYRKGLTDYLLQSNKSLKNSGLRFGLKFLFDKQ